MNLENRKIAVIGLGYVGLPLAIEYGKKYRVIGFDIYQARVEELESGKDHTLEADLVGMKQACDLYKSTGKVGLSFTSNPEALREELFGHGGGFLLRQRRWTARFRTPRR